MPAEKRNVITSKEKPRGDRGWLITFFLKLGKWLNANGIYMPPIGTAHIRTLG